jgi:tyrosinase
MATRVRRDVYSPELPEDHLTWYGRAVAEMKTRPFSDPTSWAHQAAVHGYDEDLPIWSQRVQPAQPDRPGWEQCQHQTWFFLPWHRGYLGCFEAIVARIVEDLGGPADWALPFWDYGRAAGEARRLPPAFASQQLADGSDNPLWMRRRFDAWPGWELPDEVVDSIATLDVDFFTAESDGGGVGFGGPKSDPVHYGRQLGLPDGDLENQPHNIIHGAIAGAMGNPDTAALDPIFWLHHCNIDRLWDVWRLEPEHTNPADAQWLAARFSLHDAEGNPFAFTAGDMLDTQSVLHGYRYEGVERPATIIETSLEAVRSASVSERRKQARLLAASETEIVLEGGQSRAVLRADEGAEAPAAALESVQPESSGGGRAYLNIENVTGPNRNAVYRILVKPRDSTMQFRSVGLMSTFGIGAKGSKRRHGDEGRTTVFDVTDAIRRFREAGESSSELEVVFEEALPPVEEELALESMADASPLTIGRVSLYLAS